MQDSCIKYNLQAFIFVLYDPVGQAFLPARCADRKAVVGAADRKVRATEPGGGFDWPRKSAKSAKSFMNISILDS